MYQTQNTPNYSQLNLHKITHPQIKHVFNGEIFLSFYLSINTHRKIFKDIRIEICSFLYLSKIHNQKILKKYFNLKLQFFRSYISQKSQSKEIQRILQHEISILSFLYLSKIHNRKKFRENVTSLQQNLLRLSERRFIEQRLPTLDDTRKSRIHLGVTLSKPSRIHEPQKYIEETFIRLIIWLDWRKLYPLFEKLASLGDKIRTPLNPSIRL